MPAKQKFTRTQIRKAAEAAHEVNRAYCESLGDKSQSPWKDAPEWQKDSAMMGVRAVIQNPKLTPEDSHKLWLEQKQKDGWIYGDVKDVEKKTHPCMVEYEKLPELQKVKDHLFGVVVRMMLGIKL